MNLITVFALVGPRGAVVGLLLPMLIVALVAYGVFELVRSRDVAPAAAPAWSPPTATSSALSILDERFARGEIDAEEYVQRRTLLAPATAPPMETAAPTETAEPTTGQPVADQPT